jgi:ABC-type glycerol-3-phosphate transport system permease component
MSLQTEQKSRLPMNISNHKTSETKKVFSVARLKRRITEIARYAVLIFVSIIILFPFLLILNWSLKTELDISQNPFGLAIPPKLDNLPNVWNVGEYSIYIPNTIIYSVSITIGVCFFACLAGYALARIPFPGRKLLVNLFLLGMMLPFFSIMIPLFLVARDLHILGTRWGLIIPGIALGLSFGIFLMRSFFLALPVELYEAAKIDGCNDWDVFWKIFLPLAGPGLTSLAVFQWMWTWNMFLEPLILVQDDNLRPVGLAIMFFQQRHSDDRGMIASSHHLSFTPAEVHRGRHSRGAEMIVRILVVPHDHQPNILLHGETL